MFQLILHHTYRRQPIAIDVSGFNNHGVIESGSVGFSADGAQPDSGALVFNAASSRVSVASSALFARLIALKIEAIVRLDSDTDRYNLVEGDHSFAFFIEPGGVLTGTALNETVGGGPMQWLGASSAAGAVTLHQWVKLTYLYDGYCVLRLYVDDQLVAESTAFNRTLRPVQGKGVQIGNWPAGDQYAFFGLIDDVKIWRWDPEAPYRNFFGRTPACWNDTFKDLVGHEAEDRGRTLRDLIRCIGPTLIVLVQAVRRGGDSVIRENDRFAREYRKLWANNLVDSEEMERLLGDWVEWLIVIVGEEQLRAYLRRMLGCFEHYQVKLSDETRDQLAECDPAFKGYIGVLTRVTRRLLGDL
jgi:hypothetical protein